jgi:hypothetical protein
MSYGELIKTSFWTTWRNRYLWFFGFFAGGTGFNFPAPNFGGGDFDGQDGGGASAAMAQSLPTGQDSTVEPGVVMAIVVVVLALAALFIFLSLISQGALADSVAAIDRGGERRFGTAWRSGARAFWRVLGLGVLGFVIGVAIVLVVVAPLVGIVVGVSALTGSTGATIAAGIIAGLIGLAALVVLLVPLAIVWQLALRELVLREERPIASLRQGYRLFRAELGKTLLVFLIQIGIGIGLALVLIVVGLLVGLLLFAPAIALGAGGQETAAIVAAIVAGLILLVPVIVVSGAIGTFNHAYWTLACLRLRALGDQAPAA